MERVTQHGGQLWPDEKNQHEGRGPTLPQPPSELGGHGGARRAETDKDGGRRDGWPHQAQQSEESQTDGLIKETSPLEGTGLWHGSGGTKAGSFLEGLLQA